MTAERKPVPTEAQAFAPGRVNVIGEHTDYNGGLALPFAIAQGIVVRGRVVSPTDGPAPGAPAGARIWARALDLGEGDEFTLPSPERGEGWRAFVRGTAGALAATGVAVPTARLELGGDIPRGAGLSSSAALEVALSLTLLALAGVEDPDRRDLARLCSRVESEWAGAQTGLLDQLASLLGKPDSALLIDFATLAVEPVPLALDDGWRLAVLESGERRRLAGTGYNERRAECARACDLLGVGSLRELEDAAGDPPGEARTTPVGLPVDPPATPADLTETPAGLTETPARLSERLAGLPETLARRVEHVLGENARVRTTVAALRAGRIAAIGPLLDESHASLRDLYECSTPAVEATVKRCKEAGALGARMIGGGFGGSVLGLFPPDTEPPAGALEVRPSPGARLVEARQA